VIVPSALVTRVSKELTADAFAATPVLASLTVDSSAVISVELVVMLPSAVVTLVVKALNALDVATTPVLALLTVLSSAVISLATWPVFFGASYLMITYC
jgi:hypothetical protein